MNYTKLSYGQLESLANELNQASKNMENILNDVKALLNRVTSSGAWEGTSAAQATAKFNELSAKFPEFYTAIGKCHTHLMSVIENYKSVDTSVSNL